MTSMYGNDPSGNPIDEVRFLIGDTVAPFVLSNEEIMYLVEIYPAPASGANYSAAISAAVSAASHYAKLVSKTVGSLSIQYSEQHGKYLEIAERLRAIAKSGVTGQSPPRTGVPILFGGGETILGPDNTPEYYSH